MQTRSVIMDMVSRSVKWNRQEEIFTMMARRFIKAAGLAALLVLAAGPFVAGQDIKDSIDGAIRGIRESQNQDGSYGSAADTGGLDAEGICHGARSGRWR